MFFLYILLKMTAGVWPKIKPQWFEASSFQYIQYNIRKKEIVQNDKLCFRDIFVFILSTLSAVNQLIMRNELQEVHL